MSFVDYLTCTCLRRLENYQVKPFSMRYNGKEYTIIFKWYYDNNPNDFLICEENSIIHANLNRLDQRKRL